MKKFVITAAFITLVSTAMAQDLMKPITIAPDSVTWKDNPLLPGGIQVALLVGDPTKAELIIQRVKLPPNAKIAPHTHNFAEYGTVLSGSVGLGIGEKAEVKEGNMATAGTFYTRPAKQPHYLWTGSEGAILQVQFTGPAGINFINADDGSGKK